MYITSPFSIGQFASIRIYSRETAQAVVVHDRVATHKRSCINAVVPRYCTHLDGQSKPASSTWKLQKYVYMKQIVPVLTHSPQARTALPVPALTKPPSALTSPISAIPPPSPSAFLPLPTTTASISPYSHFPSPSFPPSFNSAPVSYTHLTLPTKRIV